MDDKGLRAEICRVGKSLFDRGYAHSTAGNISVRLDDGHMITPTDACLGFLDPDRISHVDGQGAPISGDRPSKTLTLHRRIYAADKEARCVIHTHSTHLVALTLSQAGYVDDLLPPITPYFVMKVGHVPLVPYHRPGDPRVADLVASAIGRNASRGTPIRAVMLARLGPMVWHESLGAAMAALEELEETAKLWIASGSEAPSLTEAEIEELRRAFGARW